MFSEMGRQVMIMASEQSTTKKHTNPAESAKPTTTKGGGAKKSGKVPNSKKQPQRGLGVAQLERLRLQDRWKKMTEIPQPQTQTQTQHVNPLPKHQYTHLNFQYQNLPDPLSSVPVQYGASGYNVPVMINDGSGLYGVVGQRVGNGSGLGYNVGGNNLVVDHHLNPSPYGFGAPDRRFGVGAVYETSRELTSMPKMQSLSPNRCDVCCKKNKRFNSGKYMGFNGRSEKSPAGLPINRSDYADFNPETGCFGGRAAAVKKSGYSGRCSLIDESVEVRAVHRKGSSRGGGIFMEYEFFPEVVEKNEMIKRGTYPKEEEDEMLQTERAEASVSSHEEPSDITYNYYNGDGIGAADSYIDHHHDPLDLSLKLSFY